MDILIVDDDEFQREFLRVSLERLGHTVTEAVHGAEGLEHVKSRKFRLVLTDWLMPVMAGDAFVRAVRDLHKDYYIYIILVTSLSAREDVVKGLEAGADDYLTKPYNSRELSVRISVAQRVLDLETRLSSAMEQLQQLAAYDSLTGLANRRHFFSWVEDNYNDAFARREPFSVVMLDIDRFKQVNDTYGHVAGDRLLRLVAMECAAFVESQGIVARYGGEEFIVALPDTDYEAALSFAEALRARIDSLQLDLGDETLRCTVSLGVASSPCPRLEGADEDFTALIHAADEALYCAKRAGRNCVCGYDDISQQATPSSG